MNSSPHLTTDHTDSRLGHGADTEPRPQNDVYLVLSEEERAKGFVRPYRDRYVHVCCPRFPSDKFSEEKALQLAVTTMGRALSETYSRDPHFYGSTYCVHCEMHRPVAEFVWTLDGEQVGS